MPRNLLINKVKKQVVVTEIKSKNHSFSDTHETTVIRETTVLKNGLATSKKIKDFFNKLDSFAKKTGLSKTKTFLKNLFGKFADYAYRGKDTGINEARLTNTSLFSKIKQYAIHFLKMLFLTIAGIIKLLSPIAFPVFGVLLIVFAFNWLATHSVALSVSIDGNELGLVKSDSVYNDAESRVSKTVEERTGEQYTMDSIYEYAIKIIDKDSYSSPDEVYANLQGVVDTYVSQYYGFFIDGKMIAAARNEAIIEKVLETVASYYFTNDTESYEIQNETDIVKDTYAKTYLLDYDEILAMFTEPVNGTVYTVKKNDTLSSIAKDHGLSVPILKLINGDPDLSVKAGDTIRIGKPVLQLTVETLKTVTYSEVIPYTTKYIETDSLYENSTSVKNKGSNGSYTITAIVRSVNGTEVSRTELTRVKTKDAVTQQILVGTKKIAPSGSFIFPLDKKGFYKITSYFGWRTLRGQPSNHTGIDLAANYGTKIYAADAGTVCEKGYSATGLGNYVKIDHGNGIITIYGHASKIASGIKVGVKVYQGQIIAYVGSTGNSTGNHLHFGVYDKSAGKNIDPLPYIKKVIPR